MLPEVSVADVDVDGRPDVIWVTASPNPHSAGDALLSVALNQGGREFASRVISFTSAELSTAPYPIGDLNGDGTCDFAFPAFDPTGQSIAVLLMGPHGHALSQSFSVAAPIEGKVSGFLGASNAYGQTGRDLIYMTSTSSQVGTLRATRF
jgi:VCBS repeat protein